MTGERYNGWTNYATWRVNLEMIDDITSSLIGEQTFETVSDLADYLKEQVEEVITNYGELEGLAVDYAMAFLSDVNWYETAESSAEELVQAGWHGVEDCYVCGKHHDPADCGLCDRCTDYHPASKDCDKG